MATFTDDFTRANEVPLAAPWVVDEGIDLVSNAAVRTGGSSSSRFVRLDDNYTPDQSSSITFVLSGSSGQIGPAVRMNSLNGCYYVYYEISGDDIQIRGRADDGLEVNLRGESNIGLVSGDELSLEIVGSVLNARLNGVIVATATDAGNVQSSGSAGFFLSSTTASITDFESSGQTALDTIPPVITVTGKKKATIFIGDTYADEGATAEDNVDASVTVVSTDDIDTAIAGTYTVSYNATDAAGNQAKTMTRIVEVVNPTTTFTDFFNRPDEAPLAGDWESVTTGTNGIGLQIVSNEVRCNGGGIGASIVTGKAFSDAQSAEVTFGSINFFGKIGLILRGDTLGNGYLIEYQRNGDDIRVYSLDDGVLTNLTFYGNVGLINGSVFKASIAGSTLKLFRNGVQIGTDYVDTLDSHTSGSAGLWISTNQRREDIDNFVAEGVVPLATITDVDTDETLIDGQTGVTLATSGFANDITTVNLKVGADRVALTNLSGTGDSYTANLMDVTTLTSGTVGLPFSSATYQNEIEATDGTDTAVINITRNPKAGWEVVDVVGCVTTKGSIAEGRTEGAYSDGSQVLYETKDGTTIGPDLIIKSDGLTASGKVWDVDTGRYEDWTIDFPALADSTTPVLTLVPSTTVYNLTVGDNFTLPTVTVTDTDVNDDPVTATVTPTVTDNRNGQGVGSVVYTYTYTDGTNLAVPINITVNYEAVPDTSIPTLSAVPATTTYNLTNGANFTLPTISRTDNGTTAAITPVIRRNGQVVASVDTSIEGTYTITANYSDAAGNAAEPLVITVNVASAIVQSSINMTLTGIPDNQYITRVINVSTNQVIFSGNVTWANSSATQLLEEIPSGTEVEYYAIGVNDGGLNRGTTS